MSAVIECQLPELALRHGLVPKVPPHPPSASQSGRTPNPPSLAEASLAGYGWAPKGPVHEKPHDTRT